MTEIIEAGCVRICYTDNPQCKTAIYSNIPSQYQGQWVWCRQKNRNTWEVPGGHIEPGETPFQAAQRELFEESGAKDFSLYPVCWYGISSLQQDQTWSNFIYGQLFYADVHTFSPLPPHSEMTEVLLHPGCPSPLSYPDMQPHLIAYIKKWLKTAKDKNT